MSSAPSRSNERSHRSSEQFTADLARATDAVRDAVRETAASCPVVLIDGRSGAGKSSLARALVASWPRQGPVQLVALDSIYPGWDGLAEGADLARRLILTPHDEGQIGIWRRFDWDAGQFAEAHAVDPTLPLIVEGVGALTAESAPLADVRVWLESPADSRRRRALDRDGDGFRPHWERWAVQEERHLAQHEPIELATVRFALP